MKPLTISPIALSNKIMYLKNVFCDLSEDLDKINSPNPFLIKEGGLRNSLHPTLKHTSFSAFAAVLRVQRNVRIQRQGISFYLGQAEKTPCGKHEFPVLTKTE